MSTFRRLLCAVMGHAPERGVSPEWSFRFVCTRCGRCCRGELARWS